MPAKTMKMYDNLESLGATPEEVEKSLQAFGLRTLRLKRSEARSMLEDAMDVAAEGIEVENRDMEADSMDPSEFIGYTVPDDAARKAFIDQVLMNNCVVGGRWQYVTPDGQVLGCPLTLGFNLQRGEQYANDEAEVGQEDGEGGYPQWGEYFYPQWDNNIDVYRNANIDGIAGEKAYDAVGDLPPVALVLEGE